MVGAQLTPIVSAALPTPAKNDSLDPDVGMVTGHDFKWNEQGKKPVRLPIYTINHPSDPSMNLGDYMNDMNWYVDIQGYTIKKPRARARMSELMTLLRPLSDGSLGRMFATPSRVANWGELFNGNRSYVTTMYNRYPTNVVDNTTKKVVKRAYIRDIAEWSGATVAIEGLGQYDEGTGHELSTALVTTSQYPDATINMVTSAKVGKQVNIGHIGKQFYPNVTYSKPPFIQWKLEVDGKVVVDDFGVMGAYSSTYKHVFTEPGEYTVKLTVTDRVERSTVTTKKIVVSDDPPEIPEGTCSREIVEGADGSTINGSFSNPTPSGSIFSDSGEFDVVQGIPSSEYLRVKALSEEYLFENNFSQRTGTVKYKVPVKKTFTLKWTEETPGTGTDGKPTTTKTPKSETEIKEVMVDIDRPYTFWEIVTYTVNDLANSITINYGLPNEQVVIPAGVNVTADANHSPDLEDHVFPSECDEVTLPAQTIDGGKTKPEVPDFTAEAKTAAEAKIKPTNVENDRAEFKGQLIMNDVRAVQDGPTPSQIPMPSMINMEVGGQRIDPLKTNYYMSPSTGNVTYTEIVNINGNGFGSEFGYNVNSVTVHTPVVMNPKASDDKEYDQRTKPPHRSEPTNSDTERHAFILDRPFTVTLPTTGQHRNIPGYGNKDFAKYTRAKQVQFPFDVYSADKSTFYPKNTWINVPVQKLTVDFFLPVWVPEGQYTTYYRSFAINAPNTNHGNETEANVTIPNPAFSIPPANTNSAAHVATDTIAVDVVGRLFDFRITDVSDYRWEDVFRVSSGGLQHTGNYYWVGENGIDGAKRGNVSPFELPIRQGSHPKGYKNVAVKTGYHFKFDLKTKGNMFSNNDGIRVTPTFSFVDKDGLNRKEVDLYYHTDEEKFVKVGGEKDRETRSVVLNERLRNVPSSQLLSNANYYYRHGSSFNMDTSGLFEHTFTDKYLNDFTKRKTVIGGYHWMALPWQLRTWIGPQANDVPRSAMVPTNDAMAREQQWYGEYSLPAQVNVVEKGFDVAEYARINTLTDNSPIFLKDGYIIVNFNIETIQNGNTANPHLQYINTGIPKANQWKREGFNNSFIDPYGKTFNLLQGDVVFYHADESSYTDFNASGSH